MTSPSTASETFKARMREQWDLSAQGWNDNREQIRCWLRQATDTMLDRAEIGPGARVLDVAAGAGDQTLDIAQRVGPSGRVLATDISLPILEFAKENARRAGYLNVDVRRLDGERLDLPGIFDAVICRLGLMLYPNPLEGLRGMHRALKPGGRACTLVFADAASNPCIATMMTTIAGHVVPPLPDPEAAGGLLSLGGPGVIDSLFERAGFNDVRTARIAAPMKLRSVRHYLDFIRTSAGPVLQLIAGLDSPRRNAVWAGIERSLTRFSTPEGWVGPNELLLTSARHG
jgi:SAM-dependent methyltransferase